MIHKTLNIVKNRYYKYINSRYYRYPGIHPSVIFGSETQGEITITAPEYIEIGEYSIINPNTHIMSRGGVKIGRYVKAGRGLTIYSANHNYQICQSIPYDHELLFGQVIINDFVWLGANVSIVPGVEIGEGAVIGMGSVITKSIPPFAVAAGNPAKVIKYRDAKHFMKLKEDHKYYRL